MHHLWLKVIALGFIILNSNLEFIVSYNVAPVASPFFFLCQYHRDLNQPGDVQGEITLAVTIKGSPEFYEPGKVYEVTVTSSLDFDGFLMTGIYTTPAGAMGKALNMLSGNMASQQGGSSGLICAVVHSHLSHRPSKSLSFLWMAPPPGTGCVNFLATATLGNEVMFKDTLALQICEAGDDTKVQGIPGMSGVHSQGLILREDFEQGDIADPLIWSEMISGAINDQCGSVLHGKAAVFCNPAGPRSLITVPLNTTSATTLQFALGIGNCSIAVDEPPVNVFYGTERCTKWQELEQIRLQPAIETTVHILCLPPAAKSTDVCIQWYQESNSDGTPFRGCWALDNVIISNVADRPNILEDSFDPTDPGNWLFFPGGVVKRKCQSDGNALVFYGQHYRHRSVTTRDLNLLSGIPSNDIIFHENFEKYEAKQWVVKGGEVNQKCEMKNYRKSLVMSGKGSRKFCSPFVSASKAGNLRFHFLFGGDNCSSSQSGLEIGHNSPVLVYAETSVGKQILLTDVIHAAIMEPTLVSLPIPAEAQTSRTRFCWSQANNNGKEKDMWAVDNVILLPWLPSEVDHVLQFKINFQCGSNPAPNSIAVQYSTTSGHSWHPLHELCLPPSCDGSHIALQSRFSSMEMQGWNKISLPLPYVALIDGIRFRIRQVKKYQESNWAIDDVFVGWCPDACSNHGKCSASGCQCDMGFTGLKCENAVIANPEYLSEMFQTSAPKDTPNMMKVLGGDMGYHCGTLGSGKALVFNKHGPRMVISREVNSTNMRFLQFTVRLGSASRNSPCLAPDHPSEMVYVHYSCSGGLTWNLLETLENSKYREPKIISLVIPEEAQGPSCMFKIWQPYHSGISEDVWAIDDISLSPALLNVISLDFSDLKAMNSSIRYSSGIVKRYCSSSQEALSFDEEVFSGSTRSLETKSLNVGPSYMVQFDLVMGCGSPYSSEKDNQVRLEFSTNHGITWQLVYKPCLPSNGSCNRVFTKGTVYDATEFSKWKRVTVSLLPATWSSSTRFRFHQREFEESDTWAIDNLYIGPQCKDMCSGHGRCAEGTCVCDDGFFGENCLPQEKLKNTAMKRFEVIDDLVRDDFDVSGGAVVPPEEGCGLIASGSALYFYQDGIRQLVTSDIDTESTDFIQFFIRIGGGDPLTCNNASQKNEGILVQYSNDAGISWDLLKELDPENYRIARMEHVALPRTARTLSTRLRWWQPQHSGEGKDQWAVDDLYLDTESVSENMDEIYQVSTPKEHKLLSATTKYSMQRYCNSTEKVLLLNGHERLKFILTRPLHLIEGQVIMFQINIGCTKKFEWDSAVLLEYSQDSGVTWKLVHTQCFTDSECENPAREASIYYSGLYGEWRRILIPVDHNLAQKPTLLRWFQGSLRHPIYSQLTPFAINELHIGYPCPLHCLGHGQCSDQGCKCDPGFQGPTCAPVQQNPAGLVDRFDETPEISTNWKIQGGNLGTGCGNLSLGNSLYFGSPGYRIAETVDLDTTHLRSLQFIVRLGSTRNTVTCRRPIDHSENIFVQFSVNHGLTWTTLRELDYEIFSMKPVPVELDLPREAKTISTSFRFCQLLGKKGKSKAQWAVDNVQVLGNHRNSKGFHDSFSPMQTENWFLTQHGITRSGCSTTGQALVFAADHAEQHYAETWDFEILPATFLQFDISLGCSFHNEHFSVQLEFSTDRGRSWLLVSVPCVPSDVGCQGYSAGTIYTSEQYGNWTRVTVYLPQRAVSPSTRFLWSENMKSSGNAWGLDNVYLGDGCPWMCSGHGHCVGKRCVCDDGFQEPHCVPSKPLPCELRDTFDLTASNGTIWLGIYGGEISSRCGILVSGMALTFYKDGIRAAITRDVDLSSAQFIQFTLKYGCRSSVPSSVTRANGILLQYSNNGGITWNLLKELHFSAETRPQYFIIPIKDPNARTNATRLQFWQPVHGGSGVMEWAIDDFYVGGVELKPNILYDPMDMMPQPDAWLFWPGGEMGSFCDSGVPRDALVFSSSEGERSLYTRDMTVSQDYVIQFEIKVGCGNIISPEDPIHLEYSVDQGMSWQLVKASSLPHSQGPDILLQAETPSMYYSNSYHQWQRIIVPLRGLKICGNVRFRWSQGFYSVRDSPSSWAIDGIYIGPSCVSHCMGHGSCINGIMCFCDTGYEGEFCHSLTPNPSLLKDGFEGNQVDQENWELWSGAEISLSCGILISGTSLVFSYQGERMLTTQDLDLTHVGAIQFYLRLGCQSKQPSVDENPVLLQYSVDGGATWNMLEEFSFGEGKRNPHASYIAIELPHHARSNSTKLRWWQPSFNGTFLEEWALDQIFIGGDANGLVALNDDFSITKEANWILNPGAKLEPTCGSKNNFLHFKGPDDQRYAVTTDVVVRENTYVQFELVMGCRSEGASCYEIVLEFSTDMGKTWSIVQHDCLSTDADCSDYFKGTVYHSDMFQEVTRVTALLPYYTRSQTTRFRWIQHPEFKSSQTWAIGHLYIGEECERMCTGHGKCSSGQCKCDDGWTGAGCEEPKSSLPTELRDHFTEEPSTSKYHLLVGGVISDLCGPMASGTVLHFYGACSRQLVTRDMDLRNATVIHFYFRYGCISPPPSGNHTVFFQYSLNGGIIWKTLKEMYFKHYLSSSYVAVLLPEEVRQSCVRIRWWQAQHAGRAHSDWAIDDVFIGGKYEAPAYFFDLQGGHALDETKWLTSVHVKESEYCGSEDAVIVGKSESYESAILETTDMTVEKNYVLEFKITVGCNVSWTDPGIPVSLEYSVDFGQAWNVLVPECLPVLLTCGGKAQYPTVYFAPLPWRRIVIPLSGNAISRWTRFRWRQAATQELLPSHEWGLRDIYIGPQCTHHCHGHGSCYLTHCTCDKGYSGNFCQYAIGNPTQLKDDFNDDILDSTFWYYAVGGKISAPCSVLIEGSAAVFSGSGPRILETTDLDLRDAKFIQFTAQLGGKGDNLACIPSESRNQSVFLQFSVNGGITWELLYELDYSVYSNPHTDHILLPEEARTQATRLQWWQASGIIEQQLWPVFALDNVFAGGSEINDFELFEDFEDGPDSHRWWFHPYGQVEDHFCKSTSGRSLVWRNDADISERGIITRELIVEEGFMIQFKIAVGCQKHYDVCVTNHSIRVEFTKEPGTGEWELVQQACLPGNAINSECSPNEYHMPSIYSANSHDSWSQITLLLPEKTYSSGTQFRWVQDVPVHSAKPHGIPIWSIDDVYIGELCPSLCNGHGVCVNRVCHCDAGFSGENCSPVRNAFGGHKLPTTFIESFEHGISTDLWEVIRGGKIGQQCGSLSPHGTGKHLYMGDCGLREVITKEIDASSSSKLMFVLKIGSEEGISQCRINLHHPQTVDKAVLLQYSINNGASWEFIALHSASDFRQPRRLVYEIPDSAKIYGVRFRWWQPFHEGLGSDQWALDNVEIVSAPYDTRRYQNSPVHRRQG